jgi:O-antigen/teichoic acid export membrane protein
VFKHLELGKRKEALALFWKTFLCTAAIGGVGVLLYALVPHFIVSLLYGEKYQIAPLLVYMGIFVLLYTMQSIVVMLAIALKKFEVLWMLVLGSIVQVVLVALWHSSLRAVLMSSIAAILISLVLCSAVLYQPFGKEHRG